MIDTSTNTPIGKTHLTRADAQAYIDEMYAEDYGYAMYGASHEPAPQGTVETVTVTAEVSVKQPGDTVGRKPNG